MSNRHQAGTRRPFGNSRTPEEVKAINSEMRRPPWAHLGTLQGYIGWLQVMSLDTVDKLMPNEVPRVGGVGVVVVRTRVATSTSVRPRDGQARTPQMQGW